MARILSLRLAYRQISDFSFQQVLSRCLNMYSLLETLQFCLHFSILLMLRPAHDISWSLLQPYIHSSAPQCASFKLAILLPLRSTLHTKMHLHHNCSGYILMLWKILKACSLFTFTILMRPATRLCLACTHHSVISSFAAQTFLALYSDLSLLHPLDQVHTQTSIRPATQASHSSKIRIDYANLMCLSKFPCKSSCACPSRFRDIQHIKTTHIPYPEKFSEKLDLCISSKSNFPAKLKKSPLTSLVSRVIPNQHFHAHFPCTARPPSPSKKNRNQLESE